MMEKTIYLMILISLQNRVYNLENIITWKDKKLINLILKLI